MSEVTASAPSSRSADGMRRVLEAAVLAAVAIAARLWIVEDMDVWVDEANGILLADRSWFAVVEALRPDSSPPFYYWLLAGWRELAGGTPFALRGLSIVCGVCLVLATFRSGAVLHSPAVGGWAAAFVALSPTQTFHSTQARMYALLALLGLLASAAFVRALGEGRKLHGVCFAGLVVLALYTHNFALHLLPAVGAIFLLSVFGGREKGGSEDRGSSAGEPRSGSVGPCSPL